MEYLENLSAESTDEEWLVAFDAMEADEDNTDMDDEEFE